MLNLQHRALALLFATLTACGGSGGDDDDTPDAPTGPPTETAVVDLTLAGPITAQEIQLSGLTWHGDDLVLLPELVDEVDVLYAIPKAQILAALDNDAPVTLTPATIAVDSTGLVAAAPGLEGFEAIWIDGDAVTFLLEASTALHQPRGYIVAGAFVDGGTRVVIDPATVVEVPPVSGIANHANEALFGRPGVGFGLLSEVNGVDVVPPPSRARLYGPAPGFAQAPDVPFPSLEYRVTDATAVDGAGRFWVMNYFFPGEDFLAPTVDPIADRWGEGPTHQGFMAVERLVELQLFDDAIELVDAPPIQFQLVADGEASRNWEGLVRLDDRGFLLCTDAFPRTMLGFVPR